MEETIEKAVLVRAALALFDEAYVEAADPRGTWFTDNEKAGGIYGTLASISAEAASRPLSPLDPITAASHLGHLVYSLDLLNRAGRGENPYPSADWKGSWARRAVTEGEWGALLDEYRRQLDEARATLASGATFADEMYLTGTFGVIAHGAWHLGALRQGQGKITAP
jgi:hypothetical protein